MKSLKKVLFLQSFSLTQPGGGASILKKLLAYAPQYDLEAFVACDAQELPEGYNQASKESGEYHFTRRFTAIRYGLGILLRYFLLFTWDSKGKQSLKKLFTDLQPNIIHITIHGIAAPLYVYAAKKWGKAKICISIHDYWPILFYTKTPKWIINGVFKKMLFRADTIFVISEEMGVFLKEKYQIENYEVIHDGFEVDGKLEYIKDEKKYDFLYVGLIHDMQLASLQRLVKALSKLSNRKFVVGICSNYNFIFESTNVDIKNYGWLEESKVKAISRGYKYGILPVSFEKKDSLFYRTSLMTKIPFYIANKLPILYLGPKATSAYNSILRDQLGFTIIDSQLETIYSALTSIVDTKDEDYLMLLNNLNKSLQSTFNINRISAHFFTSITC